MRPRSAAIIACRIIALFLTVEAATSIISFLLIVRSFTGTSTFWAFVGSRLLIAWVLWIFADRLGEVMARGTEAETSAQRSVVDLLIIAFTIVGVVLITQAIPTMIQVAAQPSAGYLPFAPLRLSPSSANFFGDRGSALAGEAVRLAIGVVLIVGARPLAVALRRRDENEPPAA